MGTKQPVSYVIGAALIVTSAVSSPDAMARGRASSFAAPTNGRAAHEANQVLKSSRPNNPNDALMNPDAVSKKSNNTLINSKGAPKQPSDALMDGN